MSGGICVNVENAKNAWRQKGFQAGEADRPAKPPDDPDLATAYLAGHRKGAERRRRLHP